MTLHSARSQSATFAVSLAIAAALLGPAPVLADSLGQAEVGRTYAMPLGNHVARGVQAPVSHRQSDDLSAADLRRIKSLPGGPRSGDMAYARADQSVQPKAILKECATSGVTGDSPANTHGAVSTLRLVAATIREVGVYNRTNCAIISRVFTATFFAGGFADAAGHSFFATRVIYDFKSQRFLVSAIGLAPPDIFQYFAVSTSDTAAAWRFYRIKVVNGSGRNRCARLTTTSWSNASPGVNASRWLLSATESSPETTGGVILSLEKAPTINGAASPKFKCFRLENFLQPPIVRGNSAKAYFLTLGAGAGDTIQRYALTAAATIVDDSVSDPAFITIPAWSAPPNAPQPNGQELDTFDGSLRSASIQIGKFLWNVHTVNVGGQARWRLYKLSTTGVNPLLVFTPNTVAGVHHNFNASVATGSADEGAPAFVTFSRTRPGKPAGRAEMMIAKGPNSSATGWISTAIQRSASQFEFAIQDIQACNDFFGNACRWGEYSSTQIDPANDQQAWGFNQLVNGTAQSNWSTRAGHVD